MDLSNIVIGNAAGTAHTTEDVRRLAESAVTRITVVITKEKREGNRGETYYFDPATHTSLNSIGLRNEGMEWYHAAGKLRRMVEIAHDAGKELWVSVAGFSPAEFVELSEVCFLCGADGVELNLGCPNIHDGGVSKPIFSYHPEQVEAVLDQMEYFAFKRQRIGIKLSPVPDSIIKKLAPIIRQSVVTEIVAINTEPHQEMFKPDGTPALSYLPPDGSALMHTGGQAGAAVREASLRVLRTLKVYLPDMPIINVGGNFTGQDMKDAFDLGAAGCQFATAYLEYGPQIFSDAFNELVGLYEAS